MKEVESLFPWNGTVAIMDGDGAFRILNSNGEWVEKRAKGFEKEHNEAFGPVLATADSATAIFIDVRFSNKVEAINSFIRGELTADGIPQLGPRTLLQNYISDPFAEMRLEPEVKREVALVCGQGVVHRGGFCVPYFVQSTETIERITSTGTHQKESRFGPGACGVLYSSDNGKSWQNSPVGIFKNSYFAMMGATSERLYLFRTTLPRSLLVSSRSADSAAWSEPISLVETVNSDRYLVESGSNTMHLCWMDMRLKQGIGFFIHGDWDIGRKNNQVFYRNYQEGDRGWGKEKKLSGNLRYCESPSMSVEGERIVVAWHNIVKPYTRAAVYYAVSRDNGKRWSGPTKIANSEDWAGSLPQPKVILHQGIMHVFYNGLYQSRRFPD